MPEPGKPLPDVIALPRDVLEEELLLASRMRTLAVIQRGYAHDVRTPLNALQLSVELLAGLLADASPGGIPDAAWQRHIGVARDEIAKLTRLLQALEDLPHSLPAARERVDLRALSTELVPLLRGHGARGRVKISTETGQEAAEVEGARERLRQALLNVAVNVLERKPAPGRLCLRVEVLPGGCVAAELVHDGPPLPERAMDWSGTELDAAAKLTGLWAARLVAESHGGTLFIGSAAAGETLRFEFPGCGR